MTLTDKLRITNEDNMQLMARYKDNYFDLAIVDPPYGINIATEMDRSGFKEGTSKNSLSKYESSMSKKTWDNSIPTKEYFDELFRVSKNQVIWGGNYFDLCPTRCFIVWDKMTYIPTMSQIEMAWTSFKSHSQLVKINSNQLDRFHPTQKPLALYKWLLDKYAKPNDKILDTHLGSGSIAIACHDYGFDLTACELDTEYYNKSIQRIQNHLLQQRLF
jgi:site-specific DNA-methyltransferase (adenine-specific)